jgi:thiol-disulfide isomerase/thioredoxin
MISTTRRFMLAAAGTVAVAAATGKCLAEEQMQGFADALVQVRPPQKPPALSFATADGQAKTLADYSGQGVVLNLWATWCAPCVAEMPALATAASKLAADHIAVLPISMDRQGAPVVEAFYKKHDITDLPVLLDPKGNAAQTIGAKGIPTTLIIDRKGMLVARLEGAVDWTSAAAQQGIKTLVG